MELHPGPHPHAATDPVLSRLLACYARAGLPAMVHIDPTHRCDQRCPHCYLEHRTVDELTTRQWHTVLEDLADLQVIQLTIGGGEPLLRDDLPEILAAAHRLRFGVVLKTHAGLVDAALARAFRRWAVRRVDVSLYAVAPARHDEVTGRAGSHARTMSGIEALAAAGVFVRISCTTVRANLDAASELRAWAEGRGFGFLASPGLHEGNAGAPLNDTLGLASPDLRRYAHFERDGGRQSPPRSARPRPDDSLCGAARIGAYIGPSGDARPCVMWPETAGDVRTVRFSDLWRRSRVFRDARLLRHADRAECGDCDVRADCTPCAARSGRRTGDPRRPDAFDCALATARAALPRPEETA